MKCYRCENKPWRECYNKCKEIEYKCYICENIIKVKDYIEHFEKHYIEFIFNMLYV